MRTIGSFGSGVAVGCWPKAAAGASKERMSNPMAANGRRIMMMFSCRTCYSKKIAERSSSPTVGKASSIVSPAYEALPNNRATAPARTTETNESAASLPPRRRFAWQLVVTHCRVVEKRSHDGCRLFQVVALNTIEHVLIRMMRAGVVFDLVLDELKTGQPDAIERK